MIEHEGAPPVPIPVTLSQCDSSVVIVDHEPIDPAGEGMGDGDLPYDAEHFAGMDRE